MDISVHFYSNKSSLKLFSVEKYWVRFYFHLNEMILSFSLVRIYWINNCTLFNKNVTSLFS